MATNLKEIELFMLDMDGTIYLGNKLFDCTKPFLKTIRDLGKRYIFLTNNSSRNRYAYVKRLAGFGIEAKPDDIFTSGEATTIYMKQAYPNAKVCVMGMPSLTEEFEEAGFTVDNDNPDCIVVGFDTELNYAKLTHICNTVKTGIPYIVTHPDKACPVEGGSIPDVGSLMAYVEAATGRLPEVIGKPNAKLVDAIVSKYGVAASKIAMVGDRLATDIDLATNSEISSILVYTGETTREEYKVSKIRADYCFDDLAAIQDALLG